jgi:hypothetical protein
MVTGVMVSIQLLIFSSPKLRMEAARGSGETNQRMSYTKDRGLKLNATTSKWKSE